MNWKIYLCLLVVEICHSQTTDKWVWGIRGSSRTLGGSGDRRYNEELVGISQPLFKASYSNRDDQFENAQYRYEVTEEPYTPNYNTYRPRPPEQYRPDPDYNRPVNPYRPTRPTNPLVVDNYRPTNRPIGSGFRPTDGDYGSSHGLRPGIGTNGRPILTGPVPSWEREQSHRYQDYDVCKCVHSFNCNSPGIKFGSCDVDKQYCCYKSNGHKEYVTSIGRPEANIYERPRPRPVLAGPGGPIGFPSKTYQSQIRPDRRRPHHSIDYTDRNLDEAYRKGLESVNFYDTRSDSHYDRNREDDIRPYRPYRRDREFGGESSKYKNSHPLKYGLYYV